MKNQAKELETYFFVVPSDVKMPFCGCLNQPMEPGNYGCGVTAWVAGAAQQCKYRP
ncbi:hypothetical protein HAX54_047902, partial [Datura stramonium]|nr:hypothetical protein [Datura stramonium]